jgi:hypothetical protein
MKGHLKLMSHHFDTAIAREDPQLNLLDFYLFRGQPGTTVMVMTVNPNAGTKARPKLVQIANDTAMRRDDSRNQPGARLTRVPWTAGAQERPFRF